jgi:hypothetical protein
MAMLPTPEISLSASTRAHVANLIDGLALVAFDYVLLKITALFAGVGPAEVLRAGLPSMIALFVLVAALYFVLLGGLARATLGSKLAHSSVDPAMVAGVVRMLRLRRV